MPGSMTDLSHLAQDGATLAVRVTPRAARNGVALRDGQIRISVTVVPEGGKATAAAQKLLAAALGVAPSRLVLLRGAAARDKVFRLE